MKYIEGVYRGIDAGIITHPWDDEPLGPEDFYTHLPEKGGKLDGCNGRGLHHGLRDIVEQLPANARFCDLGAGAGMSASEVSTLRPDIEIATVGMSPVNPYLRISKSRREIITALRSQEQPPAQHDLHASLSAIFKHNGLDIDLLLQIDVRAKLGIFEQLKDPFITRQFIGRFPFEDFPQNEWHCINDDNGVLDKASDIEGFVGALRMAYDALTEDGLLFTTPSQGDVKRSVFETGFARRILDPKDAVILLGTHTKPHTVLARKDSPLIGKLETATGKKLRGSANNIPYAHVLKLKELLCA